MALDPNLESAPASALEPATPVAPPAWALTPDDLFLFNEGNHFHLHHKLGGHPLPQGGAAFTVWAPNAAAVSVIGDWNGWDPAQDPLSPVAASGLWTGVVPRAAPGARYKFHLRSRVAPDARLEKADPVSARAEEPPRTASILWADGNYQWGDADFLRDRGRRMALSAPMSIYEVHLGSWCRVPEDGDRPLTYRELAPRLRDHVVALGFTHVELMPIMEHPFYGSWGYQCTGYFAPTSRYGSPEDLMFLIDTLHQAGVGVLLDWVPSHFPVDAHALGGFDGTSLYEHQDPRQGFHPDWQSLIFNYGRNEVRSFLGSSAMCWLERYHADGLRVDAVASMLYLDYSRREGEWIKNAFGGRENLDAIAFLRRLNEEIYRAHPDLQTIAEESTSFPMVSRPVYLGGLGFGLKWDMGWMHDTLSYLSKDPVYRSYHHHQLTFRSVYAFHENFVLPLSHDEVVHGKGSLLNKMPGDRWQRFANLRLLYGYQHAQPGKKLLFMGGEFAQEAEWNHDRSLDWHLTSDPLHSGVMRLVADLNRLHRERPALHERDCDPAGFEWIDGTGSDHCVISFLRRGADPDRDVVLAVFNFTPVPRHGFRVGVPRGGRWLELLNSDAPIYGGGGIGNLGGVDADLVPCHGRPASLSLTLPPLAVLFLAPA